MIIFSILYAIISFSFSYFGEMITYLGMTAPMSIWALVNWLKNPYRGKKSEVTVASVTGRDVLFMLTLTAAVTAIFFFILKYLGNANLIPATISVATSFLAAYLTLKRSPYFALAYAANDIVLLVLWVAAAIFEPSYVSVVVCFAVFLFNDLYGFISWKRMQKRQHC